MPFIFLPNIEQDNLQVKWEPLLLFKLRYCLIQSVIVGYDI